MVPEICFLVGWVATKDGFHVRPDIGQRTHPAPRLLERVVAIADAVLLAEIAAHLEETMDGLACMRVRIEGALALGDREGIGWIFTSLLRSLPDRGFNLGVSHSSFPSSKSRPEAGLGRGGQLGVAWWDDPMENTQWILRWSSFPR
jgi:hypothetical protein